MVGDMITCATWADIFLNEGFATFSEALWSESKGGYAAYKKDINDDANYYLSANPGWAISNPNWAVTTPNTNTLFNYAITYAKGACVLHMLRYVLGDTLFFNGLKSYATDTFLKIPIEIKITFTTGADTLIRVMNDVNNQMYYFTFTRQPSTILFDPDNQIVLKTATLQQIAPVPVELTSLTAYANGNIVVLKWTTATEINNKGFDMERSLTPTPSQREGAFKWEKIGL